MKSYPFLIFIFFFTFSLPVISSQAEAIHVINHSYVFESDKFFQTERDIDAFLNQEKLQVFSLNWILPEFSSAYQLDSAESGSVMIGITNKSPNEDQFVIPPDKEQKVLNSKVEIKNIEESNQIQISTQSTLVNNDNQDAIINAQDEILDKTSQIILENEVLDESFKENLIVVDENFKRVIEDIVDLENQNSLTENLNVGQASQLITDDKNNNLSVSQKKFFENNLNKEFSNTVLRKQSSEYQSRLIGDNLEGQDLNE